MKRYVVSVAGMFAAVGHTVRELVFPQYCTVCDERILDDTTPLVCAACWQRVERIEPPLCPLCGRPHDRAVGFKTDENFPCAECRDRPPRWLDAAYSAAVYDDVLRDILLLFKFKRHEILAGPLAALMAEFACQRMALDEFDWIVPVPMHPVSRRERGYNQAELLARELSLIAAWPKFVAALVKPLPTKQQTRLDAAHRRKNIRGSFHIAPGVDPTGRTILIVDDVLTTGSTVDECARSLKRAGALRVGALSVARRIPDRLDKR